MLHSVLVRALLLSVAIICIGGEMLIEYSAAGAIYNISEDVPEKPVALLLGTAPRLTNGLPNFFFTSRADAAAELHRTGRIKKVIVSGDNGRVDYDETTAMVDALVQRGVPQHDIVPDYAGFRTLDSVLRAKQVFGQNSLAVVSHTAHLKRAVFIAKAYGIDAVGFAAASPRPTNTVLLLRIRETLARAVAVLDCYLLQTRPKYSGPFEPIVIETEGRQTAP